MEPQEEKMPFPIIADNVVVLSSPTYMLTAILLEESLLVRKKSYFSQTACLT